MKKIIFISAMLFMVLCVLALRPVPTPTEDSALKVSGTVTHVWEGPSYDVVFRLQEVDDLFYINRALEYEFTLDELTSLVNKEITIKYPKHWTPLDPTSSNHHISQVVLDGQILYNEIKN